MIIHRSKLGRPIVGLVIALIAALFATSAGSSPAQATVTATISGTVLTSAGVVSSAGEQVLAFQQTDDPSQAPAPLYGSIGADGTYTITGLAAGFYELQAPSRTSGFSDTGIQYAMVTVAAGASVTVNFVVDHVSALVANVTCGDCAAAAQLKISAEWLQPDGQWQSAALPQSLSGIGGTTTFQDLWRSTYRVVATGPSGVIGVSEPVTLMAGQDSQVSLTVALPTSTRVFGSDRYSTGTAVSSLTLDGRPVYPTGVNVAFLADGQNFPDALAAAPAAAHLGGPLLLTEPNSLPGLVASELQRLAPKTIVIVGGSVSVSPTVAAQALAASPASTEIRLAGADRFGTSRAIADFAYPSGASNAVVATGNNFPDALSAGGAAAWLRAPILLVNGSEGTLDAQTKAEIDKLGSKVIYIAGGTNTVSAGIEQDISNDLEAKATPRTGWDQPVRLAGSDRYDTSVQANEWVDLPEEPSNSTAVFALGTNFPDGLVAGALAGTLGAPVYITPGDCVPPGTLTALGQHDVQRVIIIGGPAALSADVEALTPCP
ncbi:cell wall-binding repeat-containing protein [Curtobacterium ammoniigenes]|uniref:cell wall-binding repeat-containing protein n=1 Tax=Curtobacterium ammoniigenes TaxID=395387 RepID=UPI00082C4B5F|nr:cell wall-binding repeat-containing protein [Curtobacterium ammoniigenes]